MALTFQKKQNLLKIRSFTDAKTWYTVNVDAVNCGCKSFEKGLTCKHLDALALHKKKEFVPKVNPTFSQALCALVKSIRIRRPLEAVYWMQYMDGLPFKADASHRFRVARRLLQGTAEDGHAIPVMEKCSANFTKLCKADTELMYLVAEVVRICKLPNWWHPDSGGEDYIRSYMLGERLGLYHKWDLKKETATVLLKMGIEEQNKPVALMACGMFWKTKVKFGATEQAELLLEMAEKLGHELAIRLCKVHLMNKGPLAGDNNFLAHAVWMMAGGVSPVAEKIEPVTVGECINLMEVAQEMWKTPHVVPSWACDGIHCAGNDTRFMGMMPEMYAVCQAYKKYGRVDPDDVWLPEFVSHEGLIVEKVS